MLYTYTRIYFEALNIWGVQLFNIEMLVWVNCARTHAFGRVYMVFCEIVAGRGGGGSQFGHRCGLHITIWAHRTHVAMATQRSFRGRSRLQSALFFANSLCSLSQRMPTRRGLCASHMIYRFFCVYAFSSIFLFGSPRERRPVANELWPGPALYNRFFFQFIKCIRLKFILFSDRPSGLWAIVCNKENFAYEYSHCFYNFMHTNGSPRFVRIVQLFLKWNFFLIPFLEPDRLMWPKKESNLYNSDKQNKTEQNGTTYTIRAHQREINCETFALTLYVSSTEPSRW